MGWGLLFLTIAIASAGVILAFLAIFWISVKPIVLTDLRLPTPVAREAFRGSDDILRMQHRVRNSTQQGIVTGRALTDTLPLNLEIQSADPRCVIAAV